MVSRRDANEQRIKAWVESMPKAKTKFFDMPFGEQYFQLQILATHPKFQRQGAGSALCAWGLRISELTGLAVCVFASPMGRLLYSHLGFTKVGRVRIGAPGEMEHVVVAAMVYLPGAAPM
jgi:predicted N-acetyltransferase YhbS